jgi:methanogenic corrinoid protein MtbC1
MVDKQDFVQDKRDDPLDFNGMCPLPGYAADADSGSAVSADALDIAAVERDTGLSKDTLRVWERRYGFPTPVRGPVGVRAYPPEQVEKLRLLKRLMDGGHRPGKLVAMTLEELQQLGQQPARPAAAAAPPAEHFRAARYLELLANHDVDALRRELGQALLRLGLERFVIEHVAPLNGAIGEAWARGEIAVAQEHIYTEALQSVLRRAIASVHEAPAGAPRALLATLPQEGHGLGLLMAEALLSLHGYRCISLGVKVPLDGIVTTAGLTGAGLVALSFSASFNAAQALAGVKELRARLPDSARLWVGGRHPALQRNLPAGVLAVPDIAAIPRLLSPPGSSVGQVRP